MDSVLTSLDDGVFHIRLHRPEAHNAFDEEMVEALHAAAAAVRQEARARVVLLEGAGKSFCAGADIVWMRRQGEASLEENQRSALRLAALYDALDGLDLPVVARVQGVAIGGGVGLVAVSDVAIAADSARFSLREVRLGLLPAVIAPYVLGKIGLSESRHLMLSGRQLGAQEAHELGLVHRVVEEEKLDEATRAAVDDLKAGGPEALARVKRLLREVPRLLLGDRRLLLEHTAREIAAARASEEGRAGARAFLEKKPPPWLAGAP